MDGPTAIYVTSTYAPHLLPAVTVCAYSYMSAIPLLQIPPSKILISKKERAIKMEYQPSRYPKIMKIAFLIFVTLIVGILAPKGITTHRFTNVWEFPKGKRCSR